MEWTSNARWVCDSETDGFLSVLTRIHCFAGINIDNPEERVFFDPSNIHLLPQFVKEARLLVFHNAVFDIPALEKCFAIKVDRNKVKCSLVMSRLANSIRETPPGAKSPHSIEAFAIRFGMHKKVHEDWSVYSEEMGERCKSDTYIGWLTLKLLMKELKNFSYESIQSEHDLAWLLFDMEQRGFYLDRAQATSLYTTAKGYADRYQKEIRKVFKPRSKLIREVTPKTSKDGSLNRAQVKCLGDHAEFACGPFSTFEIEEFNIDSPKQRVERLLEVGWIPTQFTKPSETHPKGQPKFDAEDLEKSGDKLPKEAQLLGKYLLCRSRERLASQWLDLVDDDGYIHGKVRGIGASTHRMAHNDCNMANIPSVQIEDHKPIKGLEGFFGYEARSSFGVNPKNYDEVLLGADLTAIQLRAFAHYTKDRDYISLVTDSSVDMHQVHADYLGGVPRKSAKTWLYAFLLGAGHAKLGSILGGGTREGQEAYDLFTTKIPGIKYLKEKIIPSWFASKYMVALDGRHVPVPSTHLGLASALQSFEKCVITHSLISLEKFAKEEKLVYDLRAVVHDELVATTRGEESAHILGQRFVKCVEETGVRFNSLCPLTAAYKTGRTWADVH